MTDLEKNIISMYGDNGRQWLNNLPDTVAKIAEQHHLSDLAPVANMTFNYVASGYQNDTPIILKLSSNSDALAKEAVCLKAFANHAVPELIAYDANMIIMQRALPGITLKNYFPDNDDAATKILCASIRELHQAAVPQSHDFHQLSELFKTLDQKLDIPDEILAKAKHLRDDLLKSTTKEVLLHGDLHHDNILKNDDGPVDRSLGAGGWLIIDPKGFIGDPAFEPAAYLCNPIPELLQEDHAPPAPRLRRTSAEIIAKRINICSAELGIDAQRIADWLYAKSALCWAWSLEDNFDPGYWAKLLEILE